MFRKMNVLLLAMFFSFCFHIGVSAEIYLDEETQKVWWTGADAASLNRKALVDFTGGVGNPAISTWTKKAAYTNLNTGPIQQGAGHYVDPMTGLDVKGLNQVYFDGPPGTGTQLGTNIGAYGYDRSQPVVIGKAPKKGRIMCMLSEITRGVVRLRRSSMMLELLSPMELQEYLGRSELALKCIAEMEHR